MKKTREIFNNLWPLLHWRARKAVDASVGTSPSLEAHRESAELKKFLAPASLLDQPTSPRVEWRPIEDTQRVREAFIQLRDLLYAWNLRSKNDPLIPSRLVWESGQISGHRPYFFLQPWNEMGYLFEMTQRGWVISRAEKIVNLDRFMRQLSAWDHVVLYEAPELSGTLRVKSDQWGEDFVSLPLYEDAMLRLFKELFPAESQAKRRIDF